MPAAVSPEVAVHAAEPFEAAVLASAPCVVVAPSIALPARHVTVEATIDEHCSCPVKETVNELLLFFMGTAVEPPEAAASAADSSEVSGVSSHLHIACPVSAMEAACELLPCF